MWSLALSGVRHHWRGYTGLCFSVALTVALLAGGMGVGDSLRQTLRGAALEEIGAAQDMVVSSQGMSREALADALASETGEGFGDFSEGDALFNEDDTPTEHTQAILNFCEQFEQAGHRTKLMTDELVKHGLLMDGEVSIERNSEPGKPYVYKGFQMVDQNKLRELDGEVIARWNKDGMLPLIYAHLASLDLLRVIFARQQEQGKLPAQPAAAAQ